MVGRKCPLCGAAHLQNLHGEFRFEPPPNISGGTIVISSAVWRHCSACGEDIIPHELDQAIDAELDRRHKLLEPAKVAPKRAKRTVGKLTRGK